MSSFEIGHIRADNVQVGNHNTMIVHQAISRLAREVAAHRGSLADPASVDRAVHELTGELSDPTPRRDRLTALIRTIDEKSAHAPTVRQSLDEVRQMIGID